jgi:hypothetical protein
MLFADDAQSRPHKLRLIRFANDPLALPFGKLGDR